MQFIQRKRRQAPTVIIVSLIDVLMVVLIFLMVTTTFKNQPSLKITLPESKQAKTGASEGNLLVTISKQAPYLFLGAQPTTLDQLRTTLRAAVQKNPRATVSINPDDLAPIGQVFKVLDVADDVKITVAGIYARRPGKP
ncbi:MAG: ExbD/TolR family protein [Limisphaerales bacterium]